MSVSKARRLIGLAEREPDRLRRHLLVAAALREVLSNDPIVVGGTAEEFWTRAEYHETDLDVCARLTGEDKSTLRDLGFHKPGRHWERPGLAVVVEFPDHRIDGDESRTAEVEVCPGRCRIIGLDDLYIDRLRRATISEKHEGVEFHSALAVVAARIEDIDWKYVQARIQEIRQEGGSLADTMRRLDSRIRRRVRRSRAEQSSDIATIPS